MPLGLSPDALPGKTARLASSMPTLSDLVLSQNVSLFAGTRAFPISLDKQSARQP